MNNVAVTEGDKVEAQIKFGWEIDHYNVNDLVEVVDAVSQGDVETLTEEYYQKYQILLEGRDPAEFRRHGKAPNDEEYATAMADLERIGEQL